LSRLAWDTTSYCDERQARISCPCFLMGEEIMKDSIFLLVSIGLLIIIAFMNWLSDKEMQAEIDLLKSTTLTYTHYDHSGLITVDETLIVRMSKLELRVRELHQ